MNELVQAINNPLLAMQLWCRSLRDHFGICPRDRVSCQSCLGLIHCILIHYLWTRDDPPYCTAILSPKSS